MNEIGSVGLILLLALVAGHVVQRLKIPEVTGYILAGIALGPSALGWISLHNLEAMRVLAEVALGLILLSVGTVFQIQQLSKVGPRALRLVLFESGAVFGLVSAGAAALGQPWQVALLLGAIAMETAPASTLMVLRECNSQGPLTETILGIIAVNNLVCLSMYTLVSSIIGAAGQPAGSGSLLDGVLSAMHSVAWQIAGSAALGFLVGVAVALWASNLEEPGDYFMLLLAAVLICIGVSRWLELSPLVATLTLGGAIANLIASGRRTFEALSDSDPPFYAIFFVLAGAELEPSNVPAMGLLGLSYLVARGLGKFLGARLGSRRLKLELPVQRYLSYALMAHAGLAIGITLNIGLRFPDYAVTIGPVVMSAVVVCEIIGPVGTRFSIVRSGEHRPDPAGEVGLI